MSVFSLFYVCYAQQPVTDNTTMITTTNNTNTIPPFERKTNERLMMNALKTAQKERKRLVGCGVCCDGV